MLECEQFLLLVCMVIWIRRDGSVEIFTVFPPKLLYTLYAPPFKWQTHTHTQNNALITAIIQRLSSQLHNFLDSNLIFFGWSMISLSPQFGSVCIEFVFALFSLTTVDPVDRYCLCVNVWHFHFTVYNEQNWIWKCELKNFLHRIHEGMCSILLAIRNSVVASKTRLGECQMAKSQREREWKREREKRALFITL